MNAPQTAQALEIFGEAIELPDQVRAAFLAGACAGDESVLHEVEALLKSIAEAGRFLSAPDSSVDAKILEAASQIPTGPEHPGTRIGHYKLLELIGEGGFGSVFMADQEHPVRRKVALKIIKLGMDTKQVIARFEAERQALAMMEHPSIAKVFDAGATETGRPYFVMELVRGVPITEYCDANNLSPTHRIDLFVQVCQAIQHAHQKGIIHRDLKPSNVLVTMHDDKPVPKVIDFGIAKATNARLTERTLFTEFRQFVGTPAYMSPEQAQFNDLDVDTRSDVYSLGVLLYELLTGTTPLHARELREAGYERIGQVIREAEPPKPSTRLSAMDNLPAVAAHRGTDGRRLSQLMRGELDWIVMKCLEKDRTRRYDAASALAADLKRHLSDEPVLARPTSTSYRLLKLVRRHKRAMLAVGVALAGLVGGLGAATYGLVRATIARDNLTTANHSEMHQREVAQAATVVAEAEKKSAQSNATAARTAAVQAQEISRFLQDILTAARPDRALGRAVLARDVLDGAAAKIDGGQFDEQPEIEAAIRETLGRSYLSLGDYVASDVQFQKALEQAHRAHSGDSHLAAMIITDLAEEYDGFWAYDEAVDFAREALAMEQRLDGDSTETAAAAMEALAISLTNTDDSDDEVQSLARDALAIRKKLGQTETEGIAYDLKLLSRNVNEISEQESLLRQALAIEQKLLPPLHPEIADTLEQLGNVLGEQDKWKEARVILDRALAIRKKVLPPQHQQIEETLRGLWKANNHLDDWHGLEPIILDHYTWTMSTHNEDIAMEDIEALVVTYGVLGRTDEQQMWSKRLKSMVAEHVTQLTSDINKAPNNAKPLEARAELEGRFGHYQQAADDFATAIAINPQNHYDYYFRGCLLAYLGDTANYQTVCSAMARQFGESPDASELDRTAKTCLLLPGMVPVSQSADPLTLATRAMQLAGKHDNKKWISLGLGMALYRHGDYAESLNALGAAVHDPDAFLHSAAQMCRAMAHYQLGHAEQAQLELETAEKEMTAELAPPEKNDVGSSNLENWLVCQVVRREADALIGRTHQ